jgi:hypothetical protein
MAMASLMPYGMFGDSMASKHVTWFLRKSIQGLQSDGTVQQVIHRRDDNQLYTRGSTKRDEPIETVRDTLGRASTNVPAGTFDGCLKTRQVMRLIESATKADSSIYYERNEERIRFLTDDVPITSLAREDVDDHQLGRSWKLGESSKAGPLKTLERATGAFVLVGMGKGDVTPELVPERFRKTIREQDAAQKAPAKTPAKKTSRSG